MAGNTSSNIREELHRERKRLLIFAHIITLLIYAAYFPYHKLNQGLTGTVLILCIVFLLLGLNLFLLIRLEKFSFSALFLFALLGFVYLLSIYVAKDQYIVNRQIYWAMAIVPAAFYLNGRRDGLLISIILFVSLWGLYFYHSELADTLLSIEIMLNFSGYYLAIAVISFLYAHTQSVNIRRMLRYSQDLAFANDELKIAALTDTLTCSYNRKFLDELLHELTTRQQLTFSLVMMDIDHFKEVNDIHGHQVGDDILKAVTKGLQSQLRDKDILGRWGGEEFILISQGLEADKAMQLAERLREFIEGLEFPHGLKITCSFGVVEWLNNENKTELVKRADTALYEAKKAGRNRSVLWH